MSEYMNHSRCSVCNIKIPVKSDYCLKHLSFGKNKCIFKNYSDNKQCNKISSEKNKYCDEHIDYFKNRLRVKKSNIIVNECMFVDD